MLTGVTVVSTGSSTAFIGLATASLGSVVYAKEQVIIETTATNVTITNIIKFSKCNDNG